jgi:ABC-type dipeptide/oligopeptide/nickel transport system permease subunit
MQRRVFATSVSRSNLTSIAAVVLAVIALNFLGDGLRDAADPYNK